MTYTVSDNIKRLFNLDKQIIFAVAQSLTEVAKESQKATIDSLLSEYTIRSKWYLPSNKFGIKIKAAKKNDLSASVKTDADWLALHETGGVKTPQGQHLALPSDNVRRTKRDIIVRSNRPRALKRSFVLNTKSGPALYQRTGKKRGSIRLMFFLERRAKIKKQPTVFDPVKRTVEQRFHAIFDKNLANAIKTARIE